MPEPVVTQQMMFRLPVERVFEAFVNPERTTKFWFTHSDGPLKQGSQVTWEWRMYGCSTAVQVIEVIENQSIKIEWGEENARSKVDWTFEQRANQTTMVTVTNYGFSGDENAILDEAINSMGGFSLVLANAKAYLEHGLDLNLIEDHAPDAHVT